MDINVERKEFLISLFADHTTLIVDGSVQSRVAPVENLLFFEKETSLRIKYSKTITRDRTKIYTNRKVCLNGIYTGKKLF